MDLNIIIQDVDDPRDSNELINEKIIKCYELGFKTIALAIVFDARKLGKQNESSFAPPVAPNLNDLVIPKKMKVLTRLTVIAKEPIHIYKISKSKEALAYDLLAYEPEDKHLLLHLAKANTNFEILTFNLTEHIDYKMFKVSLQKLEQNGVCIELNYGPAQLSSSLRRNIICNGQSLTEKSTRNIILSNGIKDIFRLRSPKDAKYLGVLFLLSINKCHDAVFNNGSKALNLAKHRGNSASTSIVPVDSD